MLHEETSVAVIGGASVILRLRAALSRPRRRLLLVVAVLALVGLVVSHHVEPKGMDGMAGGICLAILAGGAALLVSRPRPRRVPQLRPSRSRRPRRLPLVKPSLLPRQRAGPLYLRLSVLRN
jgi:hypothetical protein